MEEKIFSTPIYGSNKVYSKIKELGIISIEDVNNWQTLEDAIKAVEDTNKSLQMIAAPLVIDGETDRKFFNTREKILAYFNEKNITDISMQREILKEAMRAEQILYTDADTEEQKLERDIVTYLAYQWVH